MRRTPGPGGPPVRARARQHADRRSAGNLEGQLQHAAEEDRPGQRQTGGSKYGAANSAMTMKTTLSSTGVNAGQRKAAPGVEDAAGQRDQRHEEDVGEGDAGQLDGQFELAGIGGEARRRDRRAAARPRCRGGDASRTRKSSAGDMVDQQPGFLVAALVLVFAEDRHEGLRESAFGEHPAQQVGQLEGDEEGVGRQAGAKGAGDDEIADETENARQQRHAADRGEGAEKIHAQLVEQLIRNFNLLQRIKFGQ
jgi:hypothetical protein